MDDNDRQIPRIEAARRQLDAAIQLWLNDVEPLAVHTLVMASYGLLRDLTAAHAPDFYRTTEAETKRFLDKEFKRTANALKHADRDPHEGITVPLDVKNEALLGSSLVFYRVITNDMSSIMGAFHLMMLSAHPAKFNVAEDDDRDIEAGAQYGAELMRN